jgi:hypothetical protein
MRRRIIVALISVSAVVILLLITAESYSSNPPPALSQRDQAYLIFESADTAYLARRFGEAGTLYVKAYKTYPSGSALVMAAKSFWYAGDRIMASRLAIQLILKYSYTEIGGIEPEGNDIVCMPSSEAKRLREMRDAMDHTVNQISTPKVKAKEF